MWSVCESSMRGYSILIAGWRLFFICHPMILIRSVRGPCFYCDFPLLHPCFVHAAVFWPLVPFFSFHLGFIDQELSGGFFGEGFSTNNIEQRLVFIHECISYKCFFSDRLFLKKRSFLVWNASNVSIFIVISLIFERLWAYIAPNGH